jgi:hypothetical protein
MAKLRLVDRWAGFTDAELLALEDALDAVESRAPVDHPAAAVELLADEISAEIQRRGADARSEAHRLGRASLEEEAERPGTPMCAES